MKRWKIRKVSRLVSEWVRLLSLFKAAVFGIIIVMKGEREKQI